MKKEVLIVDDEEGIRFGFSRYLTKAGYSVREASTLSEARDSLTSHGVDAVLLDLNLPDGNGLDWIQELRGSLPGVAIVVITGMGDIPVAVEAMRRGADNFLTKPLSMADLDVFLQKSLELGNLRRRQLTHQRLSKREEPYFGESAATLKVRELISISAENDAPVLLLGETGSGKGVFARWIHNNSERRAEAFIEVNCSGLKGDLLASELFGHIRGAFTTALQDRQGLIEVADRGTLFLDEIPDMDLGVQAQFLKVIEEKLFRRVGETKVRRSDFRLICASNRDLEEEIRLGRFRSDLYFRISVFPVAIPPLRQRKEDIPGLIRYLLKGLGAAEEGVPPEVAFRLQEYPWPGNIRECRNILERALLLSRRGPLQAEHFQGFMSSGASASGGPSAAESLSADPVEAALRRAGGDTSKAAKELGISRATLYRKLKNGKGTS